MGVASDRLPQSLSLMIPEKGGGGKEKRLRRLSDDAYQAGSCGILVIG